jgi:hypothetical protein
MAGPLGALPVGSAASTTKVEDDVDGGPRGALPVGPAASTTEFEDDVNAGPPRGHYRWIRQRPPPSLKMMSMAGPLGSTVHGSDSVRH